jgi:hypothetical protein
MLLAYVCLLAVSARAQLNYTTLRLVDAVECATDTAHEFAEYPKSASTVERILGEPARALSNRAGDMKYFAYKLGRGKGLKSGQGYVLRIIYPEDKARSVFVLNRGCETARGFHTGRTTGDGIVVPYIENNAESLELPLTGAYESWDMLFYLHERFPGLKQPRDAEFPRDQAPADGFWVMLVQLGAANDPLSAGVAVRRIELYEAPPVETLRQPLAELPAGLPRRHLFFREEMGDSAIASTKPAERACAQDLSWYENKFRLMQVLGMRTFSPDLLEFGHNQGWDSTRYGSNDWVNQSPHRNRWSQIVARCAELRFDLLPYYEYAGSIGAKGLGVEKRAHRLDDSKQPDYTHITWAEKANADITDPATFEDLRKMLEITVVDEAKRASFAGVWLRTRPSHIPMSFSDRCLGLFTKETNQKEAVTRVRLQADSKLYGAYRAWWFGQRRAFLEKVRDYVRAKAGPKLDVLFTADSAESGKPLLAPGRPQVVAEKPELWKDAGLRVAALRDARKGSWHAKTMQADWTTWGDWEWQHSIPPADPVRYKDVPGVFMTLTVNRAYTLEPDAAEAFRAMDGLAMIRHYSLNEDATTVGKDLRVVGYFASDMDYAGPFVMLPEALAMAHGDPRYFGYLSSTSFNRGNPVFVRKFNANFLALPALPSTVEPTFSSDAEVVVRKIPAGKHGAYLAVVNIGRVKKTMRVRVPRSGRFLDAVTGAELLAAGSEIELTLQPCELRSVRWLPVMW